MVKTDLRLSTRIIIIFSVDKHEMPKSFSETWYLCKEQLLTLVTVGLYLNWSKYVTTRQD